MNKDAVQHERGPRQSTMRKQMLLMNGLQQQRIQQQQQQQQNNNNEKIGQKGRISSLIRGHSIKSLNIRPSSSRTNNSLINSKQQIFPFSQQQQPSIEAMLTRFLIPQKFNSSSIITSPLPIISSPSTSIPSSSSSTSSLFPPIIGTQFTSSSQQFPNSQLFTANAFLQGLAVMKMPFYYYYQILLLLVLLFLLLLILLIIIGKDQKKKKKKKEKKYLN
ncbi:Nuclear receptor domain-containing protein [Meloidogyne graminicola]|uniref:Nuclear receptor domain-containing protein n=1 Tax=Meloidogyne graminicola TaxID=189291 RepID=A0A8T0A2V4_9BILA|nr:Nuclear receptor domain-containing protein [Meloidogyne graminicola]